MYCRTHKNIVDYINMVLKYSGLQLKQGYHRKTRNDRRLGTEGYFTYCKNSVGPFLNNITSRSQI